MKWKVLRSVPTSAANLLACPTDGDVLLPSAGDLSCQKCAFRVVPEGSILTVRDDSGATEETVALWLMQSHTVTSIYEDLWRPLLVRTVSSPTDSIEDALVARHLRAREGLQIADLCCGTARASRRWIERGAIVLAVDRSRAMLAEARRRCRDERLVLVRGDATLPLPKAERFDAVFCFAALHLLEDPMAAIVVGSNALTRGGLLFMWALQQSGAFGPPLVSGLANRLGLRPFSVGALSSYVAASGCDVIEDVTLGAVNFVVGRKSDGVERSRRPPNGGADV